MKITEFNNRILKNILPTFAVTLVVFGFIFMSTIANAAPATTPATSPAKTPKTTTTTTAPAAVTDYWGCDALKAQISENGGGRANSLPSYCTEGAVYSKIVYWLYFILGIGAVLMLIYGGYIYMTARSNETQTKKGKTIIMYTLAGVAVAIIATGIITIIINLVVDNKVF